ncbi:Disease resistance protein RPS5 [Vitis vinifera]|uniref:Disease resistance protein RPS5 n=1 Tax=Vitis vinifera TaxID=29760 RepID=A0A438CK25_VITVI|nr:Disease resistance protein RPS5 [Vitis vinifera]
MEFLSSIVGLVPCFYDHTSKHTVYIRDLKKNLQALSKEMVDLNNLCEDVKARVERAEQRQMMRTKEVGGWIREVENMELLSSYKIGKAVSEKLAAVSGQIGKGHFDVVAEMLPRPLVDELPMEETVGSELASGWTLFQKEVGEETLSHPHILRLAKTVAEECKGLPLALITLGRALASERDPSNWDKLIQDLSKFPAEISGMEDELFHRLKVSYDRLSDDVIKSCFMYCSLFSEDWEISNENLMNLWIGEGFLGEVHDIHEACNQGRKIIKKLKHACLLESCGSREKRVTMHDVIHDMALWLYGECGKEKNKILVYNDVSRLKEAQEIPKLKEAEKMSLCDKNVEKFPKTLVCPNLKTLIIEGCHKLTKLPSGFFQFMPLIRVLDLSINDNLSELPIGIGKLCALRYLNLSYTRIRELPIELRNLKNLMILLLDDMKSLGSIPQDVISSLISLKLFSNYAVNILSGVETMLEELESLNGLSEIRITISNALSFNKLKSSHKLLRCISYLQLLKWGDVITLEISFPLLKRMEHLHGLIISHCNELKAIKINVEGEGTNKDVTLPNYIVPCQEYFCTLREVGIDHCSKLLDLTWLVYAPNLEVLYVKDCESIEQVIHGVEEKLEIFLRLKYIKLSKLPRLKSIYGHPLLFPSLEIIKVRKCKSLRSLPFDSTTSNKNLKKIKAEKSWWNQLKWNDETLKHSFTPYFQIHKAEAYLTEESETGGIDDMQEQLISN